MKYNIKEHIDVISPIAYNSNHYGLLEYGIIFVVIGSIVIQSFLLINTIIKLRNKNER